MAGSPSASRWRRRFNCSSLAASLPWASWLPESGLSSSTNRFSQLVAAGVPRSRRWPGWGTTMTWARRRQHATTRRRRHAPRLRSPHPHRTPAHRLPQPTGHPRGHHANAPPPRRTDLAHPVAEHAPDSTVQEFPTSPTTSDLTNRRSTSSNANRAIECAISNVVSCDRQGRSSSTDPMKGRGA